MASQWGGSIPPPAGVVPNLIDPHSQRPNNIALHTVCLTLSTLFVAIRLYTRVAINKAKLGLDDYFCVISWALSVTFSGLMIESYTFGIGRHMWDEPATWLVDSLKWFSIATWVYLVLTGCIKLTFLFFYYRVFSPQAYMKYWIIGGIVFVICLNTTLFLATIFDCTPIKKEWNSSLPGHCINPVILPYLSGASSSATDIFILLLPIRPLWRLNMSIARRLRILAVFGLGLFACIASLVRLGMTPVLTSSLDATWNISTITVWATIEVNVGIICSCLTVMPAFMERHLPQSVKSTAAQLWSRTLQSLSLRWSRNTTEKELPSDGLARPWTSIKQKAGVDSEGHIVLNDVPSATDLEYGPEAAAVTTWRDDTGAQRW